MAASRVRTASDGRGISVCFMSPPPPFAPNRAPATIVNLNQFLSPAAALGAAATLGVADFTGGVAGRRTPPASVAIGIEAIGLVALPLAIGLINRVGRGSTHGTRTAVGLAVLAGIGFGLFFILFHAGSGAGVTAFVSGRVGSAVASLGFALVSGVSLLPRRGTWRLLAVG